MTLLVLGLTVPALSGPNTAEGELGQWLVRLAPNALVYTMSFMTLGIFWAGQGTQLGRLARSNRYYAWIHLAFLFAVTGAVPGGRAAVVLFSDLGQHHDHRLIQLNYVLTPRIPILDRF